MMMSLGRYKKKTLTVWVNHMRDVQYIPTKKLIDSNFSPSEITLGYSFFVVKIVSTCF